MIDGFWEISSFLIILAAIGASCGLVSGLLGVGGGVMLAPALFYALLGFELLPEKILTLCIGTAMGVIALSAIYVFALHWQRQAVDKAFLKQAAPFLIMGSLLGVVFVNMISPAWHLRFYGLSAFTTALYLLFVKPGSLLPGLGRLPWPAWLKSLITTKLAFLGSYMALGGGATADILLKKANIRKALRPGTAAGVGVLLAVPAVIAYTQLNYSVKTADGMVQLPPPFSFGSVNLVAVVMITPMIFALAPAGARLIHYVKPQLVRLGLAFLWAAIGLSMTQMSGF